MKKILTFILALSMVVSLASCGKKETTNEKPENDTKIENKTETDAEEKEEEKKTENKEDKKNTTVSKSENKTEENKTQAVTKPQTNTVNNNNNANASTKPETSKHSTPAEKPVEKPAEKPQAPAQKPEELPETKPEEKPQDTTKATVANTLLADFKSKVSANPNIDVVTLAGELVKNPVIKFKGDGMEVEPGYLSGFDNTEIKGFKKGAMFAPMIGTIPFVGYVFELEDAKDTASFISTLKSSANLRWNICTSADEMVAGSSGNKVFFVMSPLSFND